MKKVFLIFLVAGALSSQNGFAANSMPSLQQCRDMADATSRLACYDALPILPNAIKIKPTSDVATRPIANQTKPDESGAPATTGTLIANQFGLEDRLAKNAETTISSQIVGNFEGWGPHSRITLANGQLWQVSDDSSRSVYIKSLKVTIRRGAFGAFYLELDGTNYSPRVKRVQ